MTAVLRFCVNVNETVPFRVFRMPCCGHRLCWVQPRPPVHCPSCGEHIAVRLQTGEYTETIDDSAWIKYRQGK